MILKSSENQPSRVYKSNSNMAPNVSASVFKGFLSRTCKICSERYIDEEIQFLIYVFTENGYERKTLEKITKNYLNELQNPPVNNEDTSEDINKVVKLKATLTQIKASV